MTIRKEWELYERAVVPQAAGPVQRIECKKSFYGGIIVLMTKLAACNSSKEMTDMLESVNIELTTFMLEIKS